MSLEGAALELVLRGRVAHLATADGHGIPHVVPICYAYKSGCFYFVIDRKPKKKPRDLKRLRNIRDNPHVALVIDRYEEDWSLLAFVLVHGSAEMVTDLTEWAAAIDLLRERYAGYQVMPLTFEENPVVRVRIHRYHFWAASNQES